MTLEEVIIQNIPANESRLYAPSKKAMENPSNGVTIINPAAAAVIRDCATMAHRYIPHYVFGLYANPFSELAAKIDLEQITDFVKRASQDISTAQLLCLILDKGSTMNIKPNAYTSSMTTNDPYGDYGADSSSQQHHDNVYILSKLFGII